MQILLSYSRFALTLPTLVISKDLIPKKNQTFIIVTSNYLMGAALY